MRIVNQSPCVVSMRILPYRSLDNYINGAVITFAEITALKRLETTLQDNALFIESMQEAVREPILALDQHLRILSPSRAFAQMFNLGPADLLGQHLPAVGGGVWNSPELRRRLLRLFDDDATEADEFDNLPLEAAFAGLGRRRVLLYGRRMLHQGRATSWVLLGVRAAEEV
jgi:two-component system CheB/CheR fusion protein